MSTALISRGASVFVMYTEDIRMSNIVTKQLVGNGTIRWFDIRDARIFLSTAPVGLWKREAMAITDTGLCALKTYSVWSNYDRGMWKRIHYKSAAVTWLIRHGHPIPDVLAETAREMKA